ncbi:MAG: hypothetical protein Q4G43_08735 [Mobilicoccus sp.]|nr:hypothetical protein [Mobilicoccus sp.]
MHRAHDDRPALTHVRLACLPGGEGVGTYGQPWSAADQRELLRGFALGVAPLSLCRHLGRTPDDVWLRAAFLLGDDSRKTGPPADLAAALDVIWLRLRDGIGPTPMTGDGVLTLWQDATGITLTPRQRVAFEVDPTTARLTRHRRYTLRTTAHELVADTGMLDLDDWDTACTTTPRTPEPLGPRPTPAAVRTLLAATLDDVADDTDRAELHDHLLGGGHPSGGHRRAVLDVVRAAGAPGPAADLRDHLLDATHVADLARALGGRLALTTTLALFGGRDEAGALRLAGRSLSPWRTPPNLGRGAVVRSRLT